MNNPEITPEETSPSFKELFINYLSDRTKDNPEAYEAIFWEVIDTIVVIDNMIEQKNKIV